MEYRERQTTMSLAKVSPRDVCTVKFIQSVLSFVCGRIVILYLNSPRLTWSQNQRERYDGWTAFYKSQVKQFCPMGISFEWSGMIDLAVHPSVLSRVISEDYA